MYEKRNIKYKVDRKYKEKLKRNEFYKQADTIQIES